MRPLSLGWRRVARPIFSLVLRRLLVAILVVTPVLGGSVIPPGDPIERVRAFTRPIEFDYLTWTLDALAVKFDQAAVGTTRYLPEEVRRQVVLDYLGLVREIQQTDNELAEVFGDPRIADPQMASRAIQARLENLQRRRAFLGPLAEAALQSQLDRVLSELSLTLGGQPVPPVLYRTSPVPQALIVSPREVIRQEANISVDPQLTVDQQETLEAKVDRSLNVSSLVVPVGGIGLYPTMIMETADLNWMAEVVAHEWIHNFLTLRPLGLNYLRSPELRTMNETAASLAGKEIGRALIAAYYPDYLPAEPPPAPPAQSAPPPTPEPGPPAFDFREEMRITRLRVDELLAEGQVEAAEAYMEARRQVFWENGYRLRKLNQAYFAFYGAYADQPGGPAGADPVGSAVRALRAQSPSLAAFLRRISWMSSFEQLQQAVGQG